MIATGEALYTFYNGFGVPAFPEEAVQTETQQPYITYDVPEPTWDAPTPHHAQVYWRGKGTRDLMELADQVITAIGSGILLPCTGGYVCLRPETPLMQLMQEDTENKRVYLNLQLNAWHMPGI